MKHILFLLFFLPVLAYAQFPASPNKIRLGNQTTADGLVVRTAASPSWTPSSINNAWLAFDTVAVKLYYYDGGTWNEYTGGSVNIGNTDLTLTGNRRLNTGGYQFWIQDGTGSEVPYIYIGGDQVSFAASTTTSVYLDSSEQRAAIVAGAVIDIDADSIRIIGTQPNDNSLNRLLAWDSITNRLHYVDKASITGSGGTDTNFATDNLTFTGNRVHNLSTRTLTIADGGTYPTFQQSAATDGIALYSSATDVIAQTPGLLQIENSDTITITADRIRMNAADTRIQQVAKDNALNRLAAIDSLTGRLYYVDKSSIAGGSGTVTGTGTTNTIAKWTSSTALGNSLFTDDGTNSVAGGTSSFRLPNGTTAQRPGSPAAGMTRYNTSNGVLEWYGPSQWEVPVESASATGMGTAARVFYADANGRAAADDEIRWDATNNRLAVGGSTSVEAFNSTGGMYIMTSAGTLALRVRGSDGLISLGSNSAGFGPCNTGGNTFGPTLGTFGFAPPSTWQSGGNHLQFIFAPRNNTLGTNSAIIFKIGGDTWSPSSGPANQTYLNISSTYNQTGTASGDVVGIDYNPIVTSVLGNHYAALFRSGRVGIGNNAPAQTLHVTGTARITGSAGTGTSVMLRDANGDISNATLSGLSVTSGTLSADNLYTANGTLSGARTVTLGSNTLTMTGTAGAPSAVNFSMNPSTNTTTFQSLDGSLNNSAMTITPARTQIVTTNVTGGTAATYGFFADSVRISPAAVANDDALTRVLAINSSTGKIGYVTKSTINAPSYNLAELTVSGGSTSATAGTPERPDNDTPGTASSTIVGTFTASGSTLDYTGSAGQVKISATISFTTSGGGDILVSIFKEGSEIASTEMREAVNAIYTTVALPAVTTSAATNDTFEIRIEPVTGSNTITVHRSTMFIEKIY